MVCFPIPLSFPPFVFLSNTPAISRHTCRMTPVALCSSVVSQTIAAAPPLLSARNGLLQSTDRPWRGGGLARAVGGIACNSIANRAIVGHSD